MDLIMKRQFVPLADEAAVAALETTVGFTLPPDYREFLLKFNGGEPTATVFRALNVRGTYSGSAVRYFFSMTDKSTFSLAYQYSIYAGAGRTPQEMLPIATDAGGNLVLLALAGPQSGKVFFWDHDIEGLVANPSSPDHLVLVGTSFTDFCNRLTPYSRGNKLGRAPYNA
jgi:cell wall assembly regulator SMI1